MNVPADSHIHSAKELHDALIASAAKVNQHVLDNPVVEHSYLPHDPVPVKPIPHDQK